MGTRYRATSGTDPPEEVVKHLPEPWSLVIWRPSTNNRHRPRGQHAVPGRRSGQWSAYFPDCLLLPQFLVGKQYRFRRKFSGDGLSRSALSASAMAPWDARSPDGCPPMPSAMRNMSRLRSTSRASSFLLRTPFSVQVPHRMFRVMVSMAASSGFQPLSSSVQNEQNSKEAFFFTEEENGRVIQLELCGRESMTEVRSND